MRLAPAAALALAACASAPPEAPAGRALALANAGFEEPARPGERCPRGWGCSMHSSAEAYVFKVVAEQPAAGAQGVCVERVQDEPWALMTQLVTDRSAAGARVRLSMAVRIERAEGAGAGPWILARTSQGAMVHQEKLVSRPGGWQRVAVEAAIPPNVQTLEAGATMQGGGRACIDEVRLEVLPR